MQATQETPVKKQTRDVRAVMTTVASGFGIMLLNACTGILTARTLKPAGRGELAAMNLWPIFLTFTTTLGIPSSIIYMMKRHPEGRSSHIPAGFTMSAFLGTLAALGGVLLLPFWLNHQYSPRIIFFAQIFLLTTPLLALIQASRSVFEAQGLFSVSNQIQLISPGTTLLGLLILLATHHLSPITAALAYTGAAVPTFVFAAIRIWPILQGRWEVNLAACRLLLNYGIRSYGVDLLGTLALQVDQVIVINLLSAAQMGGYGVILSLSRMFNLFAAAIVMVLFPKASGSSPKQVHELVSRSARIGTAVSALCSLTISLVGSHVLTLLYGKEYAGNSHCLQVLLVEVTLSGCVYILSQGFMALGRPGVVSTLQAIGLGLSIPLMLFLVPRYGIMGAALSLLLSTCARLLFVFSGFRFLLQMPLPRVLPTRRDLETLRSLLPQRASASA